MKIYIGSDHAGFELKQVLASQLAEWGHEVHDKGTHNTDSCDYPDFGAAVGRALVDDGGDTSACLGVLVCGTGIGISIAANKVPGVRAARCDEAYSASMARAHNDANILCLGSRVIGEGVAVATLAAFVNGEFEGGRHQRRVDKLEAIAEAE